MSLSSLFHLAGRYPTVARDPGFQTWLRKHGGHVWHETPADSDGKVTVVVQSLDGSAVYAMRIQRAFGNDGSMSAPIDARAAFDLAAAGAPSHVHALQALRVKENAGEILASRPRVDWKSDGSGSLSWEVELAKGSAAETFVLKGQAITKESSRALPTSHARTAREDYYALNDSTEENELHHLSQYRSLAQQWTQGAPTIGDKAFRIWMNVRNRMVYDANVTHISQFSWADSLVIDQLGWRGICDEWAIVQVTMLRAIGIPAVTKFLIWEGAGHACLEFLDNGRWRHMDALWNAMDNPGVYRQNGARNVTVMDASYPRDTRSSVPAWGVPDPIGDLKLYYWRDYVISPNYPGNARPGYSS